MDQHVSPRPVAFCSLATPNVFNQLLVLVESILQFHPEADLFVLVVAEDELGRSNIESHLEEHLKGKVHWIMLDDLNCAGWRQLAFKYSTYELCCALKPLLLQHLRRIVPEKLLVFLDADICLYAPVPLEEFAASSGALMLSLHFIRGAQAFSEEGARWERDQLPYGVFNGGFLVLRPCEQADVFLAWWADRVQHYGSLAVLLGLFLDQKWLNYVIGYFDVHVLKHPGCNLAWWNCHERSLRLEGGRYVVESEELVFFHFSGMSWEGPITLSQQSAVPLSPTSALYALMDDYRKRCSEKLSSGICMRDSRPPFLRFSNGERIPTLARLFYVWSWWSVREGVDPFDQSPHHAPCGGYRIKCRIFNMLEGSLALLPHSFIHSVTHRLAWLLTWVAAVRRARDL